MYVLEFCPSAIDFLNKLPHTLKERVFNKILSTKENPFHYFFRLEGFPDYRMRIGNYRIIADIDMISNIIRIRIIGHRRNIYDKL
jgi:mRNA interferase RelE/StbE